MQRCRTVVSVYYLFCFVFLRHPRGKPVHKNLSKYFCQLTQVMCNAYVWCNYASKKFYGGALFIQNGRHLDTHSTKKKNERYRDKIAHVLWTISFLVKPVFSIASKIDKSCDKTDVLHCYKEYNTFWLFMLWFVLFDEKKKTFAEHKQLRLSPSWHGCLDGRKIFGYTLPRLIECF